MTDDEVISALLSADDETFWQLAAKLRSSAPLNLAAGGTREIDSAKSKIPRLAKPLIKAVDEHGPSRTEFRRQSHATQLHCIEGVRSRSRISTEGYNPWAVVDYVRRTVATDAPNRENATAHALPTAEVVSLYAGVVAYPKMIPFLKKKYPKECRALIAAIPDGASNGKPSDRSTTRDAASVFVHKHVHDMHENYKSELAQNLMSLVEALNHDPKAAAALLAEFPHECRVLRQAFLEDQKGAKGRPSKVANRKTAAEHNEAQRLRTDFAKRLRRARKNAGLTALELAEKAGMKRPNISRYEAGDRLPWSDQLGRLAKALAVPVDELLPNSAKRIRPGR